jgi:acyl carrier protein phosphodiesterase
MLLQDYSILPEIFQKMILKMKEQDWLYNYQFLWGLEKSFEGVVKRSKYLNSSEEVFILFKENYETFKEYYNIFIKDIKRYAFNEYNKLLTN